MLDLVFIPFAVLYTVSMIGFVAAVLRSTRAFLGNLRSDWPLLLLALGIVIAVILLFLPSDSYETAGSLKRQILRGNLLTYIACFCVWPLCAMALACVLPAGHRSSEMGHRSG
jgi:hypothetical protein